ncbi:hypothetical protein G4V62_13940 [Bacillaceae bacterium SIJ1]|uniref:hypothetical protein n=1 Tax=Litoribacterium kuwaitense TaxID=1398745 RepID=UPI0013EAB558|nr:hypothetical protein [Litoribacterium kuwaitense]NGP45995.1 hypothetical protein [Litoribacterium kuwaitense]
MPLQTASLLEAMRRVKEIREESNAEAHLVYFKRESNYAVFDEYEDICDWLKEDRDLYYPYVHPAVYAEDIRIWCYSSADWIWKYLDSYKRSLFKNTLRYEEQIGLEYKYVIRL